MALGGNVAINGTVLNPQPSRFEAIPPKADRVQVLNGGHESAPRTKGWHFRMTYGSERFADDESLGNLRSLIGDPPGTKTLSYTDHTGGSESKTILIDEEIGDIIGIAGLAEQFSVEFYEAP